MDSDDDYAPVAKKKRVGLKTHAAKKKSMRIVGQPNNYYSRLENPDIFPEKVFAENQLSALDDEQLYEWMKVTSEKAERDYAKSPTASMLSSQKPYDYTTISADSSAIKTDFGLEIGDIRPTSESEHLPSYAEIVSPSSNFDTVVTKAAKNCEDNLRAVIIAQAYCDQPKALENKIVLNQLQTENVALEKKLQSLKNFNALLPLAFRVPEMTRNPIQEIESELYEIAAPLPESIKKTLFKKHPKFYQKRKGTSKNDVPSSSVDSCVEVMKI